MICPMCTSKIMLKKEYKTREFNCGFREQKYSTKLQKQPMCYACRSRNTSRPQIYTHYLYVFRRTSQIKHQFYVHVCKKVHSECCSSTSVNWSAGRVSTGHVPAWGTATPRTTAATNATGTQGWTLATAADWFWRSR